MIEYAIAREALRLVVAQSRQGWPLFSELGNLDPQWNLIIGTGRTLTATPHLGQAALIMLDGIEPWGIINLALDNHGLTSVLGAVAVIDSLAAVEMIVHDTFLNLGTVIALAGHGTAGKTALKLKIERPDHEPEEMEFPYGTIQVVPLGPDETANIEVRPTRQFDIVPGQPGQGASAQVTGGVLGLIIDTRGRPLRLLENDEERGLQLTAWMEGITSA
jgi:hypothetical protein